MVFYCVCYLQLFHVNFNLVILKIFDVHIGIRKMNESMIDINSLSVDTEKSYILNRFYFTIFI